jgi:hypothetical protein
MSNGTNTEKMLRERFKLKKININEADDIAASNFVKMGDERTHILRRELEEKHLELELKYVSHEFFINNCRNWLAFARDIILGVVIVSALVTNAVCNKGIDKIINLLTTDNGYMSQFALVSLLLGIVPVIMYSKKLKKESKDTKDDKKEKMDKIRKIGKDYPYGNKYGKNEEEDKDKFDK